MRILHITPHLPPDQAANALLPYHLGTWAEAAGDEVGYVAHPPRQVWPAAAGTDVQTVPGRVAWVRTHVGTRGLARTLRVSTGLTALAIARTAWQAVRWADIVHVHSNGLIAEVGALVANQQRKPVVLTLYGTEIWHYEPKRGPDLFTRAYRRAAHVVFYSHGLLTRATELGLGRRDASVIYPPVAPEFRFHDDGAQANARAMLGLRSRHLFVNVKRLHPLAGQKYLIEALSEVIRTHPDTRLVICGTGALLDELRVTARAWGVEGHVTFAGLLDNATVARYDAAADAFVLPSLLEACPTVALEALACGTPVVSSDNPGGVELRELFGFDVSVVPRENPLALARAMIQLLDEKRRTRAATSELIEREYRPAAVQAQYKAIYEHVAAGQRR